MNPMPTTTVLLACLLAGCAAAPYDDTTVFAIPCPEGAEPGAECVYYDSLATHLRSPERQIVSISGHTPGIRGNVQVIATIHQGELTGLTFVVGNSRRDVPRELIAGVHDVSANSFRLTMRPTTEPRRVYIVALSIEHGPEHARAELGCDPDGLSDPAFAVLSIGFNAATRSFSSHSLDACGEEQATR